MSRFPAPKLLFAAAALTVAATASDFCLAQGTHLWTQSRLEEFEKGTPQGVSIASDGHLRIGPAATELLTTPSTFVWSIAVDKSGNAFLGTGSPGTVMRVGKDGKPFTLFETHDLSVQAVSLGPDGALYAATVPGGKVYRLKPDATARQDDASATVVFDASKVAGGEDAGPSSAKPSESKPDGQKPDEAKPDESKPDEARTGEAKPETRSHYIWDLTFDASRRLYIATGGPGAVYRVDPARPSSAPELFFKSDEQHIRSLAWDAKGNLIAGSDGTGLVYRISPQGKGYVLFEAPRREVTAVAVLPNGTVYASAVGDKTHNQLPPLPVQGAGAITITVVQPSSLQAANTSTSLPEGSEIYAISEGQAPRKIWSGKDEIVYALAARQGGLLALSGNRGHVFTIADDGSFADVAHLEAQQGLCLAAASGAGSGDAILIGTGNTGKLISLGKSDTHEYASDVLDAGALARFGRIEVEPGSSGYELQTRSGNVEQPVRGWSEWQPLKDGAIASPAGRFLQWKAILHASAVVGGVGVNYLPVNSAPVIDDMVVVPGARLNAQGLPGNQPPTINIAFPSANQNSSLGFDPGSNPLPAVKDRTAITVRWAAHDDNGDDMVYALYLRGDGETAWRLLKDQIADKAYTFDATLIPDGGYTIKVVVSDSPSHAPGAALTGEKIGERFEVDTTPPVVGAIKTERAVCKAASCPARFHVSFTAEDAISPITHAEYSLDAGPWQYIEPLDQLSDSRREQYDFEIAAPNDIKPADGESPGNKSSEHLITVRVYDRHDNVGLAKTVIAAK